MLPVYAGLASAALNVGSSLLNRRSPSAQDKALKGYQIHDAQRQEQMYGYMQPVYGRAHHDYVFDQQRQRQRWQMEQQLYGERHQQIQNTAADAKAAGLHPLFALGGSVNSSPTIGIDGGATVNAPTSGIAGGGQFDTGSARGDVFQGVGSALDVYNQVKAGQRADKVAGASVRRDDAHAELLRSQARRLEQTPIPAQTYGLGDDKREDPRIVNYEPHRRGKVAERPIHGNKGGKWTVGKGSRQEAVEEEYGGVIGEMYGIYKFIQDMNRNAGAELNFGDYPQ